MVIARYCRISGTVQGVGFRYWAERQAARLAVVGWVRNVASGVEAVVQGEEAAVEAMTALFREGPWGARVQSVDVTGVDPEPAWERFEVRF
jgi:acylphosphatase